MSSLGPIRDRTRTHVIETDAGKITIQESPEGHIVITTDRLTVKNVSIFLNTIWADSDVAVSVNGQWLDDAYEAGQHRKVSHG